MLTDTKKAAIDIILSFLIERDIKRNEITSYFEQDGHKMSEQDLNGLFIELKQDNPQSKGLTKQSFDICLNSSFIDKVNPIKDFFKAKNKDFERSGFISQLVDSLDIVTNPELEKTVSTKEVVKRLFTRWLIGSIASVYGDNYNCLMFVLIGPKNCGKTEFFRRLPPDELLKYFAQSKLTEGKDSESLMCEKMIILMDELAGLHAREARDLRNFISSNYYTFRAPYAKQNETRKRLASVCGASNDRNIITDVENNRRIIPVEIRSVDHDRYNSVCKVSLFMEAYRLLTSKVDWNLTAEEMKYLDILSEQYELPCVEYELLQKYFSKDSPTIQMTASEIKAEIEERSHQRLSIHKIGSNLKRLGFECTMIKRNGKSSQVYGTRPVM
jgi:predicted P-loop ATPase